MTKTEFNVTLNHYSALKRHEFVSSGFKGISQFTDEANKVRSIANF